MFVYPWHVGRVVLPQAMFQNSGVPCFSQARVTRTSTRSMHYPQAFALLLLHSTSHIYLLLRLGVSDGIASESRSLKVLNKPLQVIRRLDPPNCTGDPGFSVGTTSKRMYLAEEHEHRRSVSCQDLNIRHVEVGLV